MARAPMTRRLLRERSPAWVIRPRRATPPLRYGPGVRPIQAATQAGQERTGGVGADARQRHQAPASGIVPRRLGNDPVVRLDPGIAYIGVGQQIAHALVGVAEEDFPMVEDPAPEVGHLLRQYDAEFADEAAQPIVGGGALLDQALPGAVPGEEDLRVFFLDRDEAHVGSPHGFANRGRIRRVVLVALAAHPIGGDELGRHQAHGGAVLAKLPAQWCAPEQASMPMTQGGSGGSAATDARVIPGA